MEKYKHDCTSDCNKTKDCHWCEHDVNRDEEACGVCDTMPKPMHPRLKELIEKCETKDETVRAKEAWIAALTAVEEGMPSSGMIIEGEELRSERMYVSRSQVLSRIDKLKS